MQKPFISFKRHRFPPQIIAHAAWLCVRFNLSLREVEEILLERGIDVSYETIRRWIAKFGTTDRKEFGAHQPRPGNVWHLDEVVVKIAGKKFWLWSDSDQHALVLEEINAEILLTETRALESIALGLSKEITGPVVEVALAEK